MTLFRVAYNVVISAGTVANVAYNVVIFGSIVYLQQVRDLSPIEAGVVFLALSIGASIAGQVSGRVERFPSWLVMVVAMVIGGLGTVGLSWAEEWWLYVPCFALTGFGLGLAWAFTSVATQAIRVAGIVAVLGAAVVSVVGRPRRERRTA